MHHERYVGSDLPDSHSVRIRASERRSPKPLLRPRLREAKGYDRIAGYFSSSILEVAGEALESVEGPVRVVCNSGLSCADVEVAKAAQAAMRREWCDSRPEALDGEAKPRFRRLRDFLRTGKLEVRVVPDDVFGLVHGKAGVITLADGRRTTFLGSANETGADFHERWDWLRNPFPPASEHRDFAILRNSLDLPEEEALAPGEAAERLRAADRQRIESGFSRYLEHHNPYLRTIILRTREYLENTLDPETGEPCLTPVGVRLHGDAEDEAIPLPPCLADAYRQAEAFCQLLAERANAGFFRTMLLRRMSSTMEAGRLTIARILDGWAEIDQEDDDEIDHDGGPAATLGTLTEPERRTLARLGEDMEASRDQDPKLAAVLRLLRDEGWLAHGSIVFSQYFDSVWWLADRLTCELPEQAIGVYAGASRSGTMRGGVFTPASREALKEAVRRREIRLLLGTDAASEGLNLQRLGTLINLDLPWNPSRLEQRKGRIQRIGQTRPVVDVCNLRYAGSVEDRVRELLSARLQNISRLFGQIPDTLEDVWVHVALGRIEEARKTIDAVPEQHPFALRYHEVRPVDWESCARVLDDGARRRFLEQGWSKTGKAPR